MAVNGRLRQELKIDENFKENTSFVAFQLVPEVPSSVSVCAPPQAVSTCILTSVSAGAAVGGVLGIRRHLHLGPEGPGPAPGEDSPARLLPGQLHDQGEEAGKAGPPARTRLQGGDGLGEPFHHLVSRALTAHRQGPLPGWAVC